MSSKDQRIRQFFKLVKNQPYVFTSSGMDYSSEEGQAFRAGKLNSSDIVPGLLGLGYDSPIKTWRKYQGEKQKEHDDYMKRLLEYGREREPKIFRAFKKWFMEQNPQLLDTDFFESGCFTRTDRKTELEIRATPDGHVWCGAEYACIEIKSRNPDYAHDPIDHVEKIKPAHLIQMMCQMFVTKLGRCYYVAALETCLYVYVMDYDKRLMDLILGTLKRYLDEAEETGKWPERINKERGGIRDKILRECRRNIRKEATVLTPKQE